MNIVPNSNDAALEKFLAELDTMDPEDLEGDFEGVTVNITQWKKYQTIVNSLLAVQEKGWGIVKINYLKEPNPKDEHASVMIVLGKLASLDGEAKAAVIMAASLCDRITITTNGDKVRVSFTTDNIWEN